MERRPINTFVSRLVKDKEVMEGVGEAERLEEEGEEVLQDRHLFFILTANPHPFIRLPDS